MTLTARSKGEAPDAVNVEGHQEGPTSSTSTVTRSDEQLAKSCSVPTADEFPPRIRLSARADAYLDRLADALVLDVFGLERLEGGLLAVVLAGAELRDHLVTARLTERVAYLERECDRLHFIAYNRGKTGADYYAAQTARLWAEGVA